MRKDREKLRITRSNFYDYFNKDTIKFEGILGANTDILAVKRMMKSPDSYAQIRYLYISDIINVLTRRLDKHENNHRMRKFIDRWHHARGQAYALQSCN